MCRREKKTATTTHKHIIIINLLIFYSDTAYMISNVIIFMFRITYDLMMMTFTTRLKRIAFFPVIFHV